MRASYGTGFRAPSLQDLWYPVTLGSSAQFNDPVTNQSDLQVNEVTGGNPNLKPEESTQYSFGLVFQPVPAVTIGVDYFNIKVENVISQPSTQEVVSQAALGNPLYTPFVTRDPVTNEIIRTVATLANTGTMKAEGIDLDLRYREKFGPGRLDLGLNGTYYCQVRPEHARAVRRRRWQRSTDPSGTTPVISSTIGLDGMGVVLRYKQYASATWIQGDWADDAWQSVRDRLLTPVPTWNGQPERMPTQTLWDLQVAWSGVKNLVRGRWAPGTCSTSSLPIFSNSVPEPVPVGLRQLAVRRARPLRVPQRVVQVLLSVARARGEPRALGGFSDYRRIG